MISCCDCQEPSGSCAQGETFQVCASEGTPQQGEGVQVEVKASAWRGWVSDRLGLQGRMEGYIWRAKTALSPKVKQWFFTLVVLIIMMEPLR